ncbi:TPA: hypothetical protein HA251_03380 [Candidatus Woesearchaeota archaeon]|nr:hypothetical protein [Candidatus Woesearchaeota archaeon]
MDTYGSLFASDPIFAHLMRKGFGTEEYKAGATITRLDRLLAAVTHYPEEKERYDGIKDAVTAMQQDLALTDAARNVVAGRIASIEEEVERGVDLPRKHADLESAIKEKERLLQTISQFDHERKTCDNELSAINTKDNYYARALAKVVAYLQSQDSRALGKIAASTKTSADDKLVENLARICDDITKNERTIADITARRTSVQQTLESVQDDIRRERRRIEDEERRAAERRRQEAAEAAARAAEAMRRAAQQSSHRQSSIGGGGFGGGGHRTTGGF